MNPDSLLKYYTGLAKKGKAEFAVVFTARADDEDFKDYPPVATVTVVATNPETGAMIFSTNSQMSSGIPQFLVTIPILSIPNVVKGMWNRLRDQPRPKPYSVSITVAPVDAWAEYYSETTFSVKVSPGANSAQHVWLAVKKRRHGRTILDK